MCTLHLFNHDAKSRHIEQIVKDWPRNPHGASVCFLDDLGIVQLRCQCIELQQLVDLLWLVDANQYMVHLRMSTTRVEGVQGCHMFDSPSGDWTYSHNGVIHTKEARRLRVDSLVLGNELDLANQYSSGTVAGGLPDWEFYDFANVLALDNASGTVYAHRSFCGGLTTDFEGNWSTNPVSSRYVDVPPGWYRSSGEVVHLYGPILNDCGKFAGQNDDKNDEEDDYRQCESCETLCTSDELESWGPYLLCNDCATSLERIECLED